MLTTFETDDLIAPEVNADPYGYFGHLRETDPVHWNPLFKCCVVTHYDDVMWLLRRNPDQCVAWDACSTISPKR